MELSTLGQHISANIADRLAEKAHSSVGYRGDLHVSDYSPINKTAAKVLIGYNSRLGKPDAVNIEKFVLQRFEGNIVADTKTARNYPENSVIECVVAFPVQRIPMKDKPEHFRALAGAISFLDEKFGHVWNAEKDDDGRKVLTRKVNEDIGTILDIRDRAMMTHAGTVTFSDIDSKNGAYEVSEGYAIKVWHENKEVTGVVASVANNVIRVKTKDNKVIAASPKSILGVSAVSAEQEKASNENLRAFYMQFLPADIVEQLYPTGGGKPKFESDKKRDARVK